MTQAQWIVRFKEAFINLDAAVEYLTAPPERGRLSPAEARELYGYAFGTILYLLDHPPDGAPDTADVPPIATPADPAAAHRREAKLPLFRLFNLRLPPDASAEVAEEPREHRRPHRRRRHPRSPRRRGGRRDRSDALPT